ncbi:Pentatricopeptide repeat-containing protein [Acorus calamus]|uniref:Pentatricopeptide repeat-containing protein n=1 Tax=Acorus calamus TaxID=4465 RepID=A0AAV9FC35_ACOCL|nr:Pentatricopeptide repeat-containing protein [Acorus calamus]
MNVPPREPLFTSLVNVLCEHKHVIEAEELYFKRRDFPVYIETHNMILRGYTKLGWWRKCREFWTLLSSRGSVDGHDRSIRFFREMIDNGCRPNVATYNNILK